MIRINLLPFRAARKKENIKRQISVYLLTVVLLFAVMFYYFLHLRGTLSDLRAEEGRLHAELKKYEEILKEIKQREQRIKELKAKLAVIRELEENKTGPVHLIDELAMAVPRDKLWLNTLSESKGTLTLQGTAMDNETVALFMTNLEKSKYISSVDLQSTKLRNLPEHRLRVADFVLTCKTYAYKEKAKPETQGRTTGRRGSG